MVTRSREGLGQVVVRSCIQSRRLFPVLVPGGHYQNSPVPPLPQLVDNLQPVIVRQAQVQQHHINPLPDRDTHGTLGRSGGEAGIALPFQGVLY